jgi:hypothetical protein
VPSLYATCVGPGGSTAWIPCAPTPWRRGVVAGGRAPRQAPQPCRPRRRAPVVESIRADDAGCDRGGRTAQLHAGERKVLASANDRGHPVMRWSRVMRPARPSRASRSRRGTHVRRSACGVLRGIDERGLVTRRHRAAAGACGGQPLFACCVDRRTPVVTAQVTSPAGRQRQRSAR